MRKYISKISKYYALKVKDKIVFIIPWDKQQDPILSDFQNRAVSDYNISGIERVNVTYDTAYTSLEYTFVAVS